MAQATRGRLPFGTWPSPVTARRLARRRRLNDVQWAGDGRTLVWHESQAGEGRLWAWQVGHVAARALAPGLHVRGAVDYGGGHFAAGESAVVFVAGGRLWLRRLPWSEPRPLAPEFGRSAEPALSPDGRWVVYVHESGDGQVLAAVPADASAWPWVLVRGDDFYMQPCWHPSGELLAWVAWNHPSMPWEGARLQVGRVERDGPGLRVREVRTVAGGDEGACFQPAFSPDGRYLAYVVERGEWFNVEVVGALDGQVVARVDEAAEHAVPAWQHGLRSLAWAPGGRLYFLRNRAGWAELACLELPGGRVWTVGGLEGYSLLEQPAVSPQPGPAGADLVALVACLPGGAARVVVAEIDPVARAARSVTVVRTGDPDELPDEWSPRPRLVQWPAFPARDGQAVSGWYYPPCSPEWEWEGLAPVVVRLHGGPTSQARPGGWPEVAFFTSRGYAVLEVNYRGSSGFGRSYRRALWGQWGLADPEDCAGAARFVAQQALGDPERLAVLGASAGGFTALRTLLLYPGLFRAAVCLYPVTDLLGLAQATHRFERRYLDSLVGPLPQAAREYRRRSPLEGAGRIEDPVLLFHGEEDRVVPRSQADALVEVLRRRGVACEYHVLSGEGHGFSRPESVEEYLRATEAFLRRHLGLG
ncbi:MAG TPA: prolyl oligopeptidase family serine peptidase [Limnochordales bacterium]